MRPFQFFRVEKFPKLKPGKSRSNLVQFQMFGTSQPVQTSFSLEDADYPKALQKYRVESQVRHNKFGFYRTVEEGGKLVNHEFSAFLEPVEFNAYYSTERSVLAMQTPKQASHAVVKNLETDKEFKLIEMEVDFAEVFRRHSDYVGAWFKGISPRVKSAGISGKSVQHDKLFRQLQRDGSLSCVTIQWTFNGFDQSVMITGNGGIILVNAVSSVSMAKDVELAFNVFDQLVSKVWKPKKRPGAK